MIKINIDMKTETSLLYSLIQKTVFKLADNTMFADVDIYTDHIKIFLNKTLKQNTLYDTYDKCVHDISIRKKSK